jgi:hypothetical protein
MTNYVWSPYDPKDKCFVMTTGYYGNEHNIKGFRSKEECLSQHRGKGFIVKRMRVK